MAASVLGKRRRSNLTAEAPCPVQARKRRSRIPTPQIHVEDGLCSSLQSSQDVQPMVLDGPLQSARRSPKSQDVRAKCTAPTRHTTDSEYTDAAAELNDENVPPTGIRTPSAVRFKDALAPITPKRRVTLSGKPMTPRTPRVLSTPSSKCATVYSDARQLFAQNGSPTKLIGRDAERGELAAFVSRAVKSGTGGSVYVSGPPGTGKSALVEEITKEFAFTQHVKQSVVNCVGVKSSKDIRQKIVCDLYPSEPQRTQSEQTLLSQLFLSKKNGNLDSFLVVLDELDYLLSVDSEFVYTIFEWALHRSSRLILIGIANALDLTDRFLPRLKARNLKPQLLPFMPYTAAQITSIVTAKLRSTLPADCSKGESYVPFLHPAAIQLCGKKVGSQTGDLRKVFNLVRRAIDCVESEMAAKHSTVDSPLIKQPLADITNTSPTKQTLSPPYSSPIKPLSFSPPSSTLPSSTPSTLSILTPENAPRATVAHIARVAAIVFNNDAVSRLDGLNLQQKAVLCSLVAAEKRRSNRDPFSTPSKHANKKPMLKDLYTSYSGLCKREDVLCPLSSTEFRDVVASLDTLGLVQEASARASFLTPTKTPSRLGNKSIEDKQFASAVSEREMDDNLRGPGTEILKAILHGELL